MKLNLREIIEVPGGQVPFEQDLDVSRLDFPAVSGYERVPHASGVVKNAAGVLHIEGQLEAGLVCVCDRCGTEFPSLKTMAFDAVAVTDAETDNPNAFLLEGDCLDLDDVLETLFILDMETKFLCTEDCKGVCPDCGKNLNEGPCGCRKKTDPRLAVLEQLLDDKE